MKAKTNLLKSINAVYVKAKDSELKPNLFKGLNEELKFISVRLKLTRKEAFFFSIIFCECINRNSVTVTQIGQYTNSNPIEFLENLKEVLKLIDKGLIHTERERSQTFLLDKSYKVNDNIHDAIILQTKISTFEDLNLDSAVAFVDYVSNQMKQIVDYNLTFSEVHTTVAKLIRKYKQMPFLITLKQEKLTVTDVCILLYYMGQYRMGEKSECFKSLFIHIYGDTSEAADHIQNMIAGEQDLIKTELLCSAEYAHHREFEFELAGKSKRLMRNHHILPEFKTRVCTDTFDLLYTVDGLFQERLNERISDTELLEMVGTLLKTNADLKFVEELQKLHLTDIRHKAIYLKALYEGGNNNSTCVESVTEAVYENKHRAAKLQNEFFLEVNELITRECLELSEASFFYRAKLQITQLSQDLLIDCGWQMPGKTKSNYSIFPDDIKSKPLFYNDRDATQMTMLRAILDEDKFSNIQKRMTEKAMPTGVVALLYGHPGTGKTESVYQFARQTNREVIQVDISQSKSMWFGESEKQIKKIFTRYEQYSNRCKLKPILLFNEADAIISRRKDSSSSNVAQTENAIQNILLEEFEKFTGICIATTNLVANLDPAFERRFLYKIELTKPTIHILSKIWESKLSNVSHYNTHAFATQYPFSGGQIDNIVRKIEMHEILYGTLPAQNEVEAWCDAEGFQNGNNKQIGYRK